MIQYGVGYILIGVVISLLVRALVPPSERGSPLEQIEPLFWVTLIWPFVVAFVFCGLIYEAQFRYSLRRHTRRHTTPREKNHADSSDSQVPNNDA